MATEANRAGGPAVPMARAAQVLAAILAVTFVIVGVVGFIVTGFDDWAAHDTGEYVLWFQVNPLHNIVHLALGALGLALVTRPRGAALFGLVSLIGYGAAFIYGLFAVNQTWDFLAINAADNWLHLGLAAAGLAVVALAYSARSESAGRTRFAAPGRGGQRAPL